MTKFLLLLIMSAPLCAMNHRENLSKLSHDELRQRRIACVKEITAFNKEYPNNVWKEDPETKQEHDYLFATLDRINKALDDAQSSHSQSSTELAVKPLKTIKKKERKPKQVFLDVVFKPYKEPDALAVLQDKLAKLNLQKYYHEMQVGKLQKEIIEMNNEISRVSITRSIDKNFEKNHKDCT